MNITTGLDYIRAGLLQAGLKPAQVQMAMELGKPANRDGVPAASAYALDSRFRRDARKTRIPASEVRPAVPGAVGGIRHTLMSGLTWYRIQLDHRTMPEMENLLSKFLEYLAATDLIDAEGNRWNVLTEGQDKERELILTWNDHDEQGRVGVTFDLPLPGIVWRDHPLIPVEIVVQYRMAGGQDDE